MEYWKKRLDATQQRLLDFNAERARKELKRIYKNLFDSVRINMENIYDKIMSERSVDELNAQNMDWKSVYIQSNKYNLIRQWQVYRQMMTNEISGDFIDGFVMDPNMKLAMQALDKQENLVMNLVRQSKESIYLSEMDLTMETIVQQSGIEYKRIMTHDKYAMKRMMDSVWCVDGKSWNERIWSNTNKLVEKLQEGLTEVIYTGKNKEYLVKQIESDMNVTYSAANRIVRTELSHAQNMGALDRYKEMGIERYEYIAEHNERTCTECKALDGKEVLISDVEVGVNCPPLHP